MMYGILLCIDAKRTIAPTLLTNETKESLPRVSGVGANYALVQTTRLVRFQNFVPGHAPVVSEND